MQSPVLWYFFDECLLLDCRIPNDHSFLLSRLLISIYFISFGELEWNLYLTPHDGRCPVGLSGIQTYDHPHASPELYHCVTGTKSWLNYVMLDLLYRFLITFIYIPVMTPFSIVILILLFCDLLLMIYDPMTLNRWQLLHLTSTNSVKCSVNWCLYELVFFHLLFLSKL